MSIQLQVLKKVRPMTRPGGLMTRAPPPPGSAGLRLSVVYLEIISGTQGPSKNLN